MNQTINIHRDYPLSQLTSFKIGGRAQYFCCPENQDQIKAALEWIKKKNLPYYILGGGSNTLFGDHLIQGLVISTQKLEAIQIRDNLIRVQSGLCMKKVNQFFMQHNLSGLEFSGGLPGSIGGAVYMNARSYGHEMSQIIKSVTVINKDSQILCLSNADLNYSYKSSIFMQQKDYLIYEIDLILKPGDKQEISRIYQKNLRDRVDKGQFEYPSAGCIFKNDYQHGEPTGKIIDRLGLKNKKIGGAEVYENHANFIINKNNASARDVLALIKYVEKEVYLKTGITLKRELRIIQ